MNLSGHNIVFLNIFGGESFLKSFWILILQIFLGKSCIVVCAVSRLAQSAVAIEYTHCISAEVKTHPNKCPVYDTKQSHGKVPVMLEICGIWSTSSLASCPDPHWPAVVAPDSALSLGWIEVTAYLC